jgi:hypothetical protein
MFRAKIQSPRYWVNNERCGNRIFKLARFKVTLISVLSIVAPLQDTKLHTPKPNVKARANL